MTVHGTVRTFIESNFYVANASTLTDDSSLLDQGVIDSTGILEVISFLEDEFQIEIDDEEMVPENLDSIGAIAIFVTRKLSSTS